MDVAFSHATWRGLGRVKGSELVMSKGRIVAWPGAGAVTSLN